MIQVINVVLIVTHGVVLPVPDAWNQDFCVINAEFHVIRSSCR